MPRSMACLICLLIYLTAAEPVPAETFYEVQTRLEDWADPARDGRVVPIKAYLPVMFEGPRPVILFSHGLGGTRLTKQYLGEYWASHGYVCVHIQHAGSDDSVWRDAPVGQRLKAMRDATTILENSTNRPLDVSFVIDRLEALNDDPESPWHDRLDLEHIGLAGHSFGAFTTMAVAGQTFVGKRGQQFDMRDDRIDAVIPMSPQAPKNPAHNKLSFAKIDIPVFYMTGTKDVSIVRPEQKPEERRVAFDHTPGPEQGGPDIYLVTFTDGDHMIFSEKSFRLRRKAPDRPDNAVFHPHIRDASLAFWNAYLLGDEKAREWLRDGGFAEQLGDVGVFEVKP